MAGPWLDLLQEFFGRPNTSARAAANDASALSAAHDRSGPYAYMTAPGRSSAMLSGSIGNSQASCEDISLPLPTDLSKDGIVAHAWKRILRFCDEQYEELRDTLNWPATFDELIALQHGLGRALPGVVCEWLLCCNGQEIESSPSCRDGLFFGLPFLSSDEILREWKFWRFVDRDESTGLNPRLKKRMRSCPDLWVREEYSCAGWIPLVADGQGNYLGVDLMPNPNGPGKPGQVILFGRDFDTKVVVYGCDGPDGWAKLLALFADELERGVFFSLDVSDANDNQGEDDIGYRSYFTGSGERGGEQGASFHLAGQYVHWGVLEAWADRSIRAWGAAGLSVDHEDLFVTDSMLDHAGDTSSSMHDPLDPLDQAKSRPSSSRAGSSRSVSRGEERRPMGPRMLNDEVAAESSTSRRQSQRPPPPAPQPLSDLPTLEDMRAIQATEMTHAGKETSTMGFLRNMKDAIRGPSYRTATPDRAAPYQENVELAFRPSTDRSSANKLETTVEIPLDDAAASTPAPMRSTAQLIHTRE